MRNRAPSTRIGAARDPGPVPLALPPSPDPTTESRSEAEGELDGGGEAAQRQTALLKEGRAAIKSAPGSNALIEGDLIGSAWRDWIMRINKELS